MKLSASLLAPQNMLGDLAGDWLALVFQSKQWDLIETVIEEMIAQVNNQDILSLVQLDIALGRSS